MIRRFRIRHLKPGPVAGETRELVAPTLIFPSVDGARAEFNRYCDGHLEPGDTADLIDEKGRVVGTRR